MVFYFLCSLLAKVFFALSSKILILIDDISKYNFFTADTINEFSSKIYVIIGVLMLFKLVISAVQYIVNPDGFDDKNKGLFAILKKSIIVVILLAIVPSIFTLAMEVQGDVVDQIPKVIFGNRNYSMQDASEKISMTVMSSFLQVRNGKKSTKVLNSVADFDSVAMEGCTNNWLSLNLLSGEECVYEPTVLLTPFVGLFFLYILISLVIDVATRTIKLGIVQILAPVPITAYITDEKKLTNWAKTSVQIYVDLFIRLAVIYLIIYIIQVVMADMFGTTGYEALSQEISGATSRTPDSLELGLIKIVIISALLLFAKNAPKFITELLGLKGAGEGFNDMFKRAGGLFGATLGGFRTARSNYTTQKERFMGKGYDKGLKKGRAIAEGLRSAAAGLASETGRGMLMTAQGKSFKDVRDTAFKKAIEARNRRNDRVDNLYDEEYGYRQFKRDVKREKLGIPNTASFYESVNKNLSEIRSSVDSQVSHGLKKLEDVKGQVFHSTDAKGFGKVTSMDANGNTIVQQINDMSLATARARANAEIGSYYVDDEAMVNQRRVNLINQQHAEVVGLSQQITAAVNNQNAAQIAGKPQSEIDALGRIVQQLQARYDSALQKENNMRNDENLGKIQVTDEIRGQWDVLVHTLEKQARFQHEASLLAKGDVDAVVGNEKTLGLLKNNSTLDNDKLVQEAFASLKANGVTNIGSIAELTRALGQKNAKGGYDVDPSTIEAAKVISETLVRVTNERAQINAARSKRTSQAISNEKNK